MVVYIEYAVAENFLIDFTLLYLSARTAGTKASFPFLSLSAAVGTCFAVLLPLLRLPDLAANGLKVLVSLLMCLLAVRKDTAKRHACFALAFYGYTFCLGGALLALFALSGAEYGEGGYLVAETPAALVLVFTFCFAIFSFFAVKRLCRFAKERRHICECEFVLGQNRVHVAALLDSGNTFRYRGEPVSILSLASAAALFGDFSGDTACFPAEVSTVNGTGNILLFRADELKIYSGGKTNTIKGALVGLSGNVKGDYRAILNSAYIG